MIEFYFLNKYVHSLYISKDHVSVAGLLIKAGANVNEADQKDSTPLYLAITHGMGNQWQFEICNL